MVVPICYSVFMSSEFSNSAVLIPPDMLDAVKVFNCDAEQIVARFLSTLQSCPLPATIYHYTNDVGLKGILDTGRLWLTDIFDLNDPSELHHGLSHALTILTDKAAVGPPESKIFAKHLKSFIQQGGLRKSGHYFLCSFSSCGDDLGQWRAYADNGRGYALGFDTKALEGAFVNQENVPIRKTFPLTYNDSELVEIHRKIIERMFGLISLPHGKHLESAAINAYMSQLTTWLMVHALHAAVHFKHEAYSNEKEYRFLEVHPVNRPPQVKLRARRHSLVKYREFDWIRTAVSALKRIVVGPAAERQKARRFAMDCLSLLPAGGVDIACSEIPYRAL